MNDKLDVIGQRAAACKSWKWKGGMQVVHTPRHDGATGFFLRLSQDGYVPAENEYPDLSDPATVGCLLALVREAWGDPTIAARYSEYQDRGGEWDVPTPIEQNRMRDVIFFTGKTEAEALVAALEAANVV